MKKLMLVTAVLCMACSMQAATWQWTYLGTMYQAGSSTTVMSSGTAYLFDAAVTSQSALLTLFLGGTTDISGQAVTGAPAVTIASTGKSSTTTAEFDYSTSDSKSWYMAVVSGDYLFIGTAKDISGTDTGSQTLTLASATTPSKSTFNSTVTTYSSAGWYTAAPEPASIGLLLLGLCAMGLKRKVA